MDETSSGTSGTSGSPVVKPAAKESEADIAREQHDFFNLVALVCMQLLLVHCCRRQVSCSHGFANVFAFTTHSSL